jgi:outer membrane immunogenic protein
MSKSLIVATGILAASMTAAMAADMRMPVKAPPIVDPPISWSGFYLGGDLGGSWGRGRTDQTDTVTTTTTTTTVTTLTINGTQFNGTSPFASPTGTFPQTTGPTTTTAAAAAIGTSGKANVNGFMGGGQIGYRQQYNTWVLGIEADIEGSSERGSFTVCSVDGCPAGSAIGTSSFKLRWLSTLRGTAGFLVHPKVLIYATGGLAVGDVKVDYLSGINGGSFATGSVDTTRAGYAVGGGVEGKIDQHWSVRGQYLFVDLGSISTSLAGPAATATTTGVVTTNFPQPQIVVANFPPPVVNTVATTTTTTSSTVAAQLRSRLRDHVFKIAFNYQF